MSSREHTTTGDRAETIAVRANAGAREGTQPLPFFLSHPFRYAVVAVAAALFVLLALNLIAPAVFAQSSGGDAIKSTLTNVRNYIASCLFLLGGIGLVVSLGLKAAAPVNENAQYLSHMGLKSSAIAILGSAIVGPVMGIIQGLAGG